MTVYVLTRTELGDVPAGTIGRAGEIDPRTCTVPVAFNHTQATLALEVLRQAVTILAPKAWRAVLQYRDGRRRPAVLPADPQTFDPPPEWRVPEQRQPKASFLAAGAGPAEAAAVEHVTFRRSHIPEASTTWVYREERQP